MFSATTSDKVICVCVRVHFRVVHAKEHDSRSSNMSPSDFLDSLMGRTSGYDARIRPNFKGLSFWEPSRITFNAHLSSSCSDNLCLQNIPLHKHIISYPGIHLFLSDVDTLLPLIRAINHLSTVTSLSWLEFIIELTSPCDTTHLFPCDEMMPDPKHSLH